MRSLVYHTVTNQLRITRIISIKNESSTVKTFTFRDRECVRAKPGQFLMLWIPGIDEIPLSILDANTNGIVSVAVKCVGEATRALHSKRVADLIGVRGPFGNNFTAKGRKLLMVGGGTGIAPLLFLTKRLVSRTVKTTFVLGAKTKDDLLFMSELEKFGTKRVRLVTSTEDGSCGIIGFCTEPVERILAKEKFDVIYACGPEKMILKVFELAEKHGIGLQASLERLMRCAIGVCGSCIIGRYRVCTDGPVFTFRQLREVKDEFGFSKRDPCGRRIPLDYTQKKRQG
jgi:dihydroorotate dehydrogenase electron transfer subunit